MEKEIPLFNTYIHPSAAEKVKAVLDSTFLSEGKLVKEFESRLSGEMGLTNPVTVNSGTSALHLALVLAGVGPGDEVIIPAQTFVASGLAVLYQGAVPVFADIQYETGNIDPKSIEEKVTPKTKAIIPVHWAGYPCDMDEILAIAHKYDVAVIEDAAHALGATYKGKVIGSISDFTCFSFQAIKHLTTGDGGATACKDAEDAARGFVFRWFGIDRANAQPSILGERKYDISLAGFKYHMNDYAAGLGLANMERFSDRIARRRNIASQYREAFKDAAGIALFDSREDRESAHWLFGMHVQRREDFIRTMRDRGIMTSVVHLGIDHNTVFGGTRSELSNQLRFNDTQIHIPLHDALTDEQVAHIIDSVRKGW